MRRFVSRFILASVMVLVTSLTAGAGGFHFKSSGFSAGSLTFSGVGVGLGNAEYMASMDATATVRALCQNKGGTAAAGRNDIFVSVPGPQDQIIRTEDNGQTSVSLTVEDPTITDLDAPPSTKQDCPNGKWSIVDVVVMEWTSAHIFIAELGTGDVLFDQSYVCSGGGVTLDSNGNPIPNGQGGYLLNPVSCLPA